MSESNSTSSPDLSRMAGACGYCSTPSQAIVHGGPCPRVRAIEYHPNGSIKRVEFNAEQPQVSIAGQRARSRP